MNDFFLDLLKVVPLDSTLFIQAPSLSNPEVAKLLEKAEVDYYQFVALTEINKSRLVEEEKMSPYSYEIHSLEIKFKGEMVFEGYDGVEFGQFSRRFNLPSNFVTKYFPTYFTYSSDW